MIILDKNVDCHIAYYVYVLYIFTDYDIYVKLFCNLINVPMCLNRYMDNKFA